MRQRQPLSGALGHGSDSAAAMGRRRDLVRRRADPQGRLVPAQRLEAAQSGEFEIGDESRQKSTILLEERVRIRTDVAFVHPLSILTPAFAQPAPDLEPD